MNLLGITSVDELDCTSIRILGQHIDDRFVNEGDAVTSTNILANNIVASNVTANSLLISGASTFNIVRMNNITTGSILVSGASTFNTVMSSAITSIGALNVSSNSVLNGVLTCGSTLALLNGGRTDNTQLFNGGAATQNSRCLTIAKNVASNDYDVCCLLRSSVNNSHIGGINFRQSTDNITYVDLASIKLQHQNNGNPDLSFNTRTITDAFRINSASSQTILNTSTILLNGAVTSAAQLNVSGNAFLNSLVASSITSTGNLNVSGIAAFNSLNSQAITAVGILNVSGASNLNVVAASGTITANNGIALPSGKVLQNDGVIGGTGGITSSGNIQTVGFGQLNAGGNCNITGALTVTGSSFIVGDASLNNATANNITILSSLNLPSARILQNDGVVGGTGWITTTGNIVTLGTGELNAGGNCNIGGALTITGSSFINGSAIFSTSVSLLQPLNINNITAATANISTLNINGLASMTSLISTGITSTGNLNVSSTSNLNNARAGTLVLTNATTPSLLVDVASNGSKIQVGTTNPIFLQNSWPSVAFNMWYSGTNWNRFTTSTPSGQLVMNASTGAFEFAQDTGAFTGSPGNVTTMIIDRTNGLRVNNQGIFGSSSLATNANYTMQIYGVNSTGDTSNVLLWKPSLSDSNLYTIGFNYTGLGNLSSVAQCGIGMITTSRGIQNPTSYYLCHHINATAEWGVNSTGWKNLLSVKGDTGDTVVRGQLSNGNSYFYAHYTGAPTVNISNNVWTDFIPNTRKYTKGDNIYNTATGEITPIKTGVYHISAQFYLSSQSGGTQLNPFAFGIRVVIGTVMQTQTISNWMNVSMYLTAGTTYKVQVIQSTGATQTLFTTNADGTNIITVAFLG